MDISSEDEEKAEAYFTRRIYMLLWCVEIGLAMCMAYLPDVLSRDLTHRRGGIIFNIGFCVAGVLVFMCWKLATKNGRQWLLSKPDVLDSVPRPSAATKTAIWVIPVLGSLGVIASVYYNR